MECIFRNQSNTLRRTDIPMILKMADFRDFLPFIGCLQFHSDYGRK
ncbi:MAG: hypothetical protein A4E34_00361 [Methanoregula sp. PtaU1.Bin006]|nr:MAG: hypothetical protein A4E34_00361 [Methanoregula sp. PtaU1.Bin006]